MLSRGSHGRVLLPGSSVSSLQLRSYKLAGLFSRLTPAAGFSEKHRRSPLRHSFYTRPRGRYWIVALFYHIRMKKVKRKFYFFTRVLFRGIFPAGLRAPGRRLHRPSGRSALPNDASQVGPTRPHTPRVLFVRTKSTQKGAGGVPPVPQNIRGFFGHALQVKSCGTP